MSTTNKQIKHCKIVFFIFCILLLSPSVRSQSKDVKVIELRNYQLKPGQRDNFIDSFENILMDTLNGRKNHVLGQYTVKGAPDNFLWIRGFEDMPSRLEALNGFYSSKFWENNQSIAARYILGYTDAYLLKPLQITGKKMDSIAGFEKNWFGKPKGIAVVELFIANEMRDQLIEYITTRYDSIIHASGVNNISYWISESTPNNYPRIPLFQDKNLLVSITFFRDENEYNAITKKIQVTIKEDLDFKFDRVVTTKTTWILYPTKKSFNSE